MNNKGFTLVELLATIVILGIVMGIAINGVAGYIKSSKKSSEKIFTEKTGKLIEEYLSSYGEELNTTPTTTTFNKEYEDLREESKVRIVEVTATKLDNFKLSDLIEKKLVDIDKFINPANKEKCLVKNGDTYTKDVDVRVWKDTDYVYYYYVDLKTTNTYCKISEENGIITNIPENLCTKIPGTYTDGKCTLS